LAFGGATSTANQPGPAGVAGTGGSGSGTAKGGTGVVGTGGSPSGDGVAGNGRTGISASGGFGGKFVGGDTFGGSIGGYGVEAIGGSETNGGISSTSGPGIYSAGGNSNDDGYAGTGGIFFGGNGGNSAGGVGISVNAGAVPGKGLAGEFFGDVVVGGTLKKSAGSFKIDHPLDPANKYLYHSFVESPDMMNIYNGIATLNSEGRAEVALPAWFEALNSDFRCQLTAIGGPGPNLHISRKVQNLSFEIAGGEAGLEVSWQLTGIRHDAYANAHRIPVEEDKPAAEKGYYLSPESLGQPEEKSINWAHHPNEMKRNQKNREDWAARKADR
jgi:hypothetical protein